jgi:hypothetical protein
MQSGPLPTLSEKQQGAANKMSHEASVNDSKENNKKTVGGKVSLLPPLPRPFGGSESGYIIC